MNKPAAVAFLAGTLGGWLGIDDKKPRKGERAILDTFGERVMLAYDIAEDELEKLRASKVKVKGSVE